LKVKQMADISGILWAEDLVIRTGKHPEGKDLWDFPLRSIFKPNDQDPWMTIEYTSGTVPSRPELSLEDIAKLEAIKAVWANKNPQTVSLNSSFPKATGACLGQTTAPSSPTRSPTGALTQGDFDKSLSISVIENPPTVSQPASDIVSMPSGIVSSHVSPSCGSTGELNQGDFDKSPSISVIENPPAVSQPASDIVPVPSPRKWFPHMIWMP
jgi:hypothetical protein